MLGGSNFVSTNSSVNQKMMNSSGGYSGIMTHGQAMTSGTNNMMHGSGSSSNPRGYSP